MLATLWVPSENHDVDVSQLTRKARLASARVVQPADSYQSSFSDTSSLGGTGSAERGFVPQDASPEVSDARETSLQRAAIDQTRPPRPSTLRVSMVFAVRVCWQCSHTTPILFAADSSG